MNHFGKGLPARMFPVFRAISEMCPVVRPVVTERYLP